MVENTSQSDFEKKRIPIGQQEGNIHVVLFNNRGDDYIQELRKDLSRMIKGSLHNEDKSWNVEGAKSVVSTLLNLAASPWVTVDRQPVIELLNKLSEKDNKFTKANPDVFGGIQDSLNAITAATFKRGLEGPQREKNYN